MENGDIYITVTACGRTINMPFLPKKPSNNKSLLSKLELLDMKSNKPQIKK